MKLKVKKITPDATMPTKAHPTDVGWDLTATSEKVVNEKDYGYIEYGTGLSVTPPLGYYAKIVPRSSISKTGLWLANSIGTIDPDYTGELVVRFKWIPGTKKYKKGDRIAQLILEVKVEADLEEVEDLVETERGAGGFGSTGE